MEPSIHALINSPAYDFLRTNKQLADNLMLLTITGSRAHGTQNEQSDLDLRGVAFETKQDIFGLSHFEQYVDQDTDTVIFGFKKLVTLCLNANPNTLEIICSPQEYILSETEDGKLLRNNIDLFLSKKIIQSYHHYAASQKHIMLHELPLVAHRTDQEHYKQKCNKATSHVIRLLITGINLLGGKHGAPLGKEEITLLINLRNNQHTLTEMIKIIEDYEAQFHTAALKTQLPEKPQYAAVEELMIALYEKKFLSPSA